MNLIKRLDNVSKTKNIQIIDLYRIIGEYKTV